MSRRSLLIICVAAFIVAGLSFYLVQPTSREASPPPETTAANDTDSGQQAAQPDGLPSEEAAAVPADTREDEVELKRQKELFLSRLLASGEARLLGIENWAVSRGWGERPYAGSSAPVLEELIAAGDTQAMLELARMQLVARPDEALDLLTTASTRGLSSASVLGAQLLSGQAQRIKDADEKAARFVDAYAWALVAQIRNDPAGITFTDHIERIFGLSNSEKAMACSKAATIYGNLTSARSDSGLAGFDNAPPVRALRDLSQIGAECADWPTQRPNCNLVPFGDDLPLVKVYECSLQE